MIDGDPGRLLFNTLWYAKPPANAALNPNSAKIASEFVRQKSILAPIVNTKTWTAELVTVPKDQPHVQVICANKTNHQADIGLGGLPIPPDFVPTVDNPADLTKGDNALLLYQPDAPNGGYLWELQHFVPATATTLASCNSLSRMSGVNTRASGHFVDWVTGPGASTPGATYSTWEAKAWGIQGSGLPYPPGVLTMADIRRGRANHALLVEVIDAGAGLHVWPAARTDGSANPDPTKSPFAWLAEGMRICLPPASSGYVVPTTLDPITYIYALALQEFGWIITDRTEDCLAVRAHPSCAAAIGGNNHLLGVPWGDVRCLAAGSDTNWFPTA